MKGIILAGGAGTRLYPLTACTSKQLQPVYDKPMIYYPLATLMLGGIRDVLLISSPRDLPRFEELLGDGSQWGICISYKVQARPDGIAQAFLLAADFIGEDAVTLILGDNIFYGNMKTQTIFDSFEGGGLIFGYFVQDPERYGVVEFTESGKVLGIEEKPATPKSHYAVPGLYVYDNSVIDRTRRLQPSARGELEITDLNMSYLNDGKLKVQLLGRGIAWLDTGTPASLLEAANFIATVQKRQGLRISCLEEVAVYRNFITLDQLRVQLETMPVGDYRDYLEERFFANLPYFDPQSS